MQREEKQPNIIIYTPAYFTPTYYTPNYYPAAYYPPAYYPPVYYPPPVSNPQTYYITTYESPPSTDSTVYISDAQSIQVLAESAKAHLKSLSQLFAVSGTFDLQGNEIDLEGNDPEKTLEMLISGIDQFLEQENLSHHERTAITDTCSALKQALQFKKEEVSKEEISQLAQSQKITAFYQGFPDHSTYGVILNKHQNLKSHIVFAELNRGDGSSHHKELKNNKINSAFPLKLRNAEDIDYIVQNAIYSSRHERENGIHLTYEVFPSYYSEFKAPLTTVEQSPQHVGSCSGASAKALIKLLLQVEMGSQSKGEKLYDKLIANVKMESFVKGYLKMAQYQQSAASNEDVSQAYLTLFRPKFTHHESRGKLIRDTQLMQEIIQRLSRDDAEAAAMLEPLNDFAKALN